MLSTTLRQSPGVTTGVFPVYVCSLKCVASLNGFPRIETLFHMSTMGEALKRYFDVIVIVPLEEEFEIVLEAFQEIEDLSTSHHIRFVGALPGQATRILLVKQSAMGKTACQEVANECLDEFDCGVLVCIGIAGALSRDLSIGDICYTGAVCDVLDNAKIEDSPRESAGYLPLANMVSLTPRADDFDYTGSAKPSNESRSCRVGASTPRVRKTAHSRRILWRETAKKASVCQKCEKGSSPAVSFLVALRITINSVYRPENSGNRDRVWRLVFGGSET